MARTTSQLVKANRKIWGHFSSTGRVHSLERGNKLSEALRNHKLKMLAKGYSPSKAKIELLKANEKYWRIRKRLENMKSSISEQRKNKTAEEKKYLFESNKLYENLNKALNRHRQLELINEIIFRKRKKQVKPKSQ